METPNPERSPRAMTAGVGYRHGAWPFAGGVATHVVLAAVAVLVNPTWGMAEVASLAGCAVLALALLVLCLIGRLPRARLRRTLLALTVLALEDALRASSRDLGMLALSGLHPLAPLALLGLALLPQSRARGPRDDGPLRRGVTCQGTSGDRQCAAIRGRGGRGPKCQRVRLLWRRA